jgi:hypothetical protein
MKDWFSFSANSRMIATGNDFTLPRTSLLRSMRPFFYSAFSQSLRGRSEP